MKRYLSHKHSGVYHELNRHSVFHVWISDCNVMFGELDIVEGRPRGKRKCRNCMRVGRVEIGTAKQRKDYKAMVEGLEHGKKLDSTTLYGKD